MSSTIKKRFDAILTPASEEEFELKASMLAMQFLSIVDKAMEERGISKKWLAAEIGTSAAFITQMFRGDRKPNWNVLARMQKALALEFKVTAQTVLSEDVGNKPATHRKESIKKPKSSVV